MKLLVFLLLPCLSLSEVGDDFRQCKQFLLNGVPPQFTPSQIPTANPLQKPTANPLLALSLTGVPPRLTVISTAHICQCLWDDSNVKKYLYATLYNTEWRIPIYSAYVFGKGNTGRCDPWYIEAQLDGGNNADPCMGPQDPDQPIGNNQALNRDYYKSKYDKGHQYPVQHTNNPLSMLATSTLTNAAPQDRKFNRGAWRVHEEKVIKALKDCKKAYVVTGVVPDPQTKIPQNNPKKKINKNNNNNKVAVSQYYWRATCCQDNNNKFTGQGYYGPDNGVVTKLTITALEAKLAGDYGVDIAIFPSLPLGAKRPAQGGCN